MRTKELVEVALKTGEILLCNGAEVYRVEETITRVFSSYGKDCEVFVLLSGIFITAREEDGNDITLVKRIKGHTFNLKKIELVNSFSRDLVTEPLDYRSAMEALDAIQQAATYSFKTKVLCSGATAFAYALLFNGSLWEAIAALFISIFVFLVKTRISKTGFFQFFEFFVSGILVGLLSFLATKTFPFMDIGKIIIGAVMILVPGVAITTGIKDALYGDIVSSLYRISEAIFIAIAVGSGVGIILSIGLRYL